MKYKLIIFLSFIIPPAVFLLFFNWVISKNIDIPAVVVGYAFIITLGLLLGFAIDFALEEIDTRALRNEKIKKLQDEYKKLGNLPTGLSQNELAAFRIYCNTLMEI